MDNHELMTIRADTLFRHDAQGRMECENDPEGRPAPRLFLGCTKDGYVMRFGQAVPDALTEEMAEIVDRYPANGELNIQPVLLTAMREVLQQHTPIVEEEGGPAYCFPESITRAGEVVQITDENVELARYTYPWLLTELAEWWPCFAVVSDEAAVSICFSARVGDRVCEAGVNTLPEYRGRGYAAAVTAAWGAAIRDSGRVPLYSTSWQNVASQGVARRLGLIMFGTDVTLK